MGGGRLSLRKKSFSSFRSFLKISSVLLLNVFLFTGCGSSGGGDNAGSSGNTGGSSATNEVTGKVVYSGIQPNPDLDKVCYDRNGNKQCDEGEPFAFVSAGGSYKITDATEDDVKKIPLVAELFGNDASASGKILAKAQANDKKPIIIFETPVGKNTISSVTTVIKSKMDTDVLSLAEAEKQTKEALKLETGTGADLYDTSTTGKIAEAAEKVAIVMKSLLDVLKNFNITISEEAIILVMKDIAKQLPNIVVKEKDKLGEIKDQTTIGQGDKDSVEVCVNQAKSAVQTVSDAISGNGLTGYSFEFYRSEGSSKYDLPVFALWELKTDKILIYQNTSLGMKLPTTDIQPDLINVKENEDNTVSSFDENGQKGTTILKIETVKLDNKILKASPRYPNQFVLFSEGAKMYKLQLLNSNERIDDFTIDDVRAAISNEWSLPEKYKNAWMAAVSLSSDSSKFINLSEENGKQTGYEIIMNNDNTYSVKQYGNERYRGQEPFTEPYAVRSGTYEVSEDKKTYTFKDNDGVVVFKVFSMQEQDKPYEYIMAGYIYDIEHETMRLFNETAAKDIIEQWVDE